MNVTDGTMPASWAALPERLRKPFWTVREAIEATSLSRSTLGRRWADPRSNCPKPRHEGSKLLVPALAMLRYLEGAA